jgi:hypothetical protein
MVFIYLIGVLSLNEDTKKQNVFALKLEVIYTIHLYNKRILD